MDDPFEWASAMLALAVCAILLVAGEQYLEKHPEFTAASAPLHHVAER
jgi:hypothetical protein